MWRSLTLCVPLFLSACTSRAPVQAPQNQIAAITAPTDEPAQDTKIEKPPAIHFSDSSPAFLYKHDPTPEELAAGVRFIEALVELEKLRRKYPERYEATLNEAILIHEYGDTLGVENGELVLLVAIRMYHEFIQQAQNDPDARDAVRSAKDRLSMIESVTICDFGLSSDERKRLEAEEKQRAAEEEVQRP